MKITTTVACDELNNPIIASSVEPKVTHSADIGSKTKTDNNLKKLTIKSLDGRMSNSEIKFGFYDDGRLKSLNATTTGQGEAVLKSAISLAGAVAGMVASEQETNCKYIKEAGGGKPLTLIFSAKIDLMPETKTSISPVSMSEIYFNNLQSLLPDICAIVDKKPTRVARFTDATDSKDKHKFVYLELKQPALMKITVNAGDDANDDCNLTSSRELWSGNIPVAQNGWDYSLPIPRAKLFGKQSFGLTLSESGTVTSLSYAKDSGANQALGVGNTFAGEFASKSDAERAAAIKAEADVIAQQQRLVACVADPTACK